MKFIKKVLLFMLGMTVFTISVNAQTTKFSAGNYISNVYIKKVSSTGEISYMQARFIINNDDGLFAYCLDPFIKIGLGENYNVYDSTQKELINMSDELWEKVNTIANFGYGYYNHNSTEWYAATQIAIWRAIDPNANIYYTDTLNGNKTTTYEYMVDEINQLADNYLDEVIEYNVYTTYDRPIVIAQLDSLYKVDTNQSGIRLDNNNNLILDDYYIGTKSYSLIHGDSNYSNFYLLDNYQRILKVRSLPPKKVKYNITLKSGKLNVAYRDDNYYSNCISENKTTYGLYDGYDNLIQVMEIDDIKNFSYDNLAYGYYYIKQISVGCSYEEDDHKYEININNESKSINIDLHKKTKNIEIDKKYCSEDVCLSESNAEFIIFDDNKTFNLKTDLNGHSKIKLGMGIYTLKQISGIDNYSFINDITLNLSEYLSDSVVYYLRNNIKRGNIYVYVSDEEDNLIKNSEICLYDSNHNEIKCKKTNNDGYLVFEDIKLGKYYVKQKNVNEKYILDNTFKEVELIDSKTINIVNTIRINEEKNIIKQLTDKELDIIIDNTNDYVEVINEDNNTMEDNNTLKEYIPDTGLNDIKKYIILILCIIGISLSLYTNEKKDI